MGYYMAGDYYAAGGLFSFLGGAIKGAVGGFLGGGPIGAITGAIKGATGKSASQTALAPPVNSIIPLFAPQGGGSLPVIKTPGVAGVIQRLAPGGATGYEVAMPYYRKRRRMNVANPKALRRAIRREQGFVKLARRALKGTGYRIASRGSARRPVSVRESGPGNVIVR